MSPDGDLPKTLQSSLWLASSPFISGEPYNSNIEFVKSTYFKPLLKGEAVERF